MTLKFPDNKGGFGALASVLLISFGTIALLFVTLGASVSYSDMVFRKELRIQKTLDMAACADTTTLIRAKDIFASGVIHLSEFNCDIQL